MIADLVFDSLRCGVRAARFVRRPRIPLDAACLVANGLRETLRELFDGDLDVVIGEPVAIERDAWAALTRDAHAFVTRGRQTDVVLILPLRDARALVARAFGEVDPIGEGACSALETLALERIAARCAGAFDALCAERRGPAQRVTTETVPPCVAVFDVRVRSPIPLTLGVGIVRDLPDPGPSGGLDPRCLNDVTVDLHAEFASGRLAASVVAGLRVGSVVRLDTQVGAPAALKLGGQRIAAGTCGIASSRAAFLVTDVPDGAFA